MTSNQSQTAQAQETQVAAKSNRVLLALCDLDSFEEGLLPVLRHFLQCLAQPERQSWQFAYKIAVERWGESQGLPIAHALFKLVQFTLKARRVGFDTIDPLELDDRAFVTRDEQAFLLIASLLARSEQKIKPADPNSSLFAKSPTPASAWPRLLKNCCD